MVLASAKKLHNEAETKPAPLQRASFHHLLVYLTPPPPVSPRCAVPEPPAPPASITLPLAPHWSLGDDAAWKRRDRSSVVMTGEMNRAGMRERNLQRSRRGQAGQMTDAENKSPRWGWGGRCRRWGKFSNKILNGALAISFSP